MSALPILFFLLALLFYKTPALAKDTSGNHNCIQCHSLKQNEAVDMLKPLGLSVKSVKHAPVSGMFEVLAERNGVDGIIYIDYGKKYLMQGVIVDVKKLGTVVSQPHTVNPEKKLDAETLRKAPAAVK